MGKFLSIVIGALATIFGIIFLLFYVEEVTIEPIETIEFTPATKEVFMEGKITKLNVFDNVIFITLDGTRKEVTDVILFPEDSIFLKEGQNVEISGVVEEYQGKKEVIASKIVVK